MLNNNRLIKWVIAISFFMLFISSGVFANPNVLSIHFKQQGNHQVLAFIKNNSVKVLSDLHYTSNDRINFSAGSCRAMLRPRQRCYLPIILNPTTRSVILTIKNEKQNLLPIYKYKAFKVKHFKKLDTASSNTSGWVPIAENLYGGNFLDLTVNPKDPNIMIATTSLPSKVFLSHDGGKTWQACQQKIYGGEHLTWFHGYLFSIVEGYQLMFSSNNGVTWKKVSGIKNIKPLNLTVNDGKLYELQKNGSIFVTNDGLHWNQHSQAIPNSDTAVVASSFIVNGKRMMISMGGYYEDDILYTSSDSGQHWQILYNLPSGTSIVSMIRVKNTIYAGTTFFNERSGDTINHLIKTTDYGKTWQYLGGKIATSQIQTMKAYHGKLYVAIVVPSGQVGQQGKIYATKDDGLNWVPLGISTKLNTVAGIRFINNTVWLATYSHLRRFDDTTKTWQLADKGIAAIQLNTIYVNHKGWLYTGTLFGQLYISKDQGKTWKIVQGLPYVDHSFMVIPPISESNINGEMYLFNDPELYSSKDNGVTWTKLSQPVKETDPTSGINDIVVRGNQIFDNIFTIGGYKIYTSQNDGKSWHTVCIGHVSPTKFLMAVGPTHVFTGDADPKYIDYDCNNILPSGPENLLGAILYNNNKKNGNNGLLVWLYGGTKGGSLLDTSDNGLHWHSLNTKVLSAKYGVDDVSFNYNSTVMMATTIKHGAFYSLDNGKSWHALGEVPRGEPWPVVTFKGKIFYALGGYNTMYKYTVNKTLHGHETFN